MYYNKRMLTHIPPAAILCRYQQTAPGIYNVVTAQGKTLAPSFYDLRHTHTFFCDLLGAGGWVVLLPKPQEKQLSFI